MSRRVTLALAALACAVLAVPVRAATPAKGGAQSPPDVKAMIERNKQCIREASAHVAKTTFARGDLEKYLAEWQSFDALDIDDLSKEEAEGGKCVDLAAAVKEPKYVAWARARGLDPKDWLLKSMRITMTYAKRRTPQQTAEMKAQFEAQRRELSQHCKSMGPNACREMERGFAEAEVAMRETSAMMALFPEPTRAEAALLAEYDGRLRQAIEGQARGRLGGSAGDLAADGDEED